MSTDGTTRAEVDETFNRVIAGFARSTNGALVYGFAEGRSVTVASGGLNEAIDVCVLGPVPEFSYPMHMLMQQDLRQVPRVMRLLALCQSEVKPVPTGMRAL